MIQFACPTCKTALQSASSGTIILCPKCQTKMQVPPAPTTAVVKPPTLPPHSIAEWYHSKNGQQQGPVSVEQLRALIAPADLVWKQGMAGWVAAGTIPNLLPPARSAPPPMPPLHHAPPSLPPLLPEGKSGKVMPGNPPKDPILMAVLSVIFPWLGQLLIG
jgi:DNA-directed RNA polymerase subunit RPC12/RpoP